MALSRSSLFAFTALLLGVAADRAAAQLAPSEAVRRLKSIASTVLGEQKAAEAEAFGDFLQAMRTQSNVIASDPNRAAEALFDAMTAYARMKVEQISAAEHATFSISDIASSFLSQIEGPPPEDLLIGGGGVVDEFRAALEAQMAKTQAKAEKVLAKLEAQAEATGEVAVTITTSKDVAPASRAFGPGQNTEVVLAQPTAVISITSFDASSTTTTFFGLDAPNESSEVVLQPSDGPSFTVNVAADATGLGRFQVTTTAPGTRSFVACFEKGVIANAIRGLFPTARGDR